MNTRVTNDITNQTCVECSTVLETATSLLHGRAPKAGDVTICLYCSDPHAVE